MAHGLPVVSSDLPTSQEIMGDFGLYFRNGNINELAQRLEDATRLDWDTKSKEAIKISQRFEVAHIIKQWKQLIETETSIHE
jgi:glycosyltransferase involved in cell wall biosynthesis